MIAVRVREKLREAWQRLRAEPFDAPYLVEYPATPERDLTPSDVTGLVIAHDVVRHDDTRALVTVWSSRDAYLRERARIEGRWKIRDPIISGHISNVYESPTPWWRRIRLQTVVLALAAFLGGLEAIKAHYDWLFLRPQLVALADRSMHVDYVAGQQIDETISVTNRTPVTHDNLSFTLTGPPGVQKLAVEPPQIRSLPAGDTVSLRLLGTAAKRGQHKVTLKIASRAGLIGCFVRECAPLQFDIPIHVWSAEPAAGVAAAGMPPGQLAGWVETGQPAEAGLRCTVEITGDYGIEDVVVDMPGTPTHPKWSPAGTGITSTGYVEWNTKKMEAFRRSRFRLVVSSPRTLDWEAVARNSTVTCTESRPREGGQS